MMIIKSDEFVAKKDGLKRYFQISYELNKKVNLI